MTQILKTEQDDDLPEAQAKRSRWFGLVWAVPLAALLIVAYLGIQALANRGIDIVVTFNDATGVSVGDTKLIYQGVIGGKVTKIQINEDGHHVDVTIRVDRRAERGLNTNTKFWLVGEKPDLSDISSVKAALLGLSIGVAPGVGGVPTRQFVGLDSPPVIVPGTPGTAYQLTANRLSSVKSGSSVFYHGQEVGKVTDVHLNARSVFRIDIFVLAPFDKLVDAQSMYWISSPFKVDVSDGGVSANVEHAGTLLTGGIEMDTPDRSGQAVQSPAGTVFPLYADEEGARSGPTGPKIRYAMNFNGNAGDLSRGAPIRFLGFRVGVVESVHLDFDARTGAAKTSVIASMFPARLGIATPAANGSEPPNRSATDAAMQQLIAVGYRARLVEKPPLIGGLIVNLDQIKGAAQSSLGHGDTPSFPTVDGGGGVDDITNRLDKILTKVDQVPIEAIGQEIHGLTANLNRIVSSPQVTDSIQHLDSTLAQVDQMMTQIKPEVGPLIQKLNQTADEVSGTAAAAQAVLSGQGANQDASVPAAIEQLTEAARSIRTLADYLGRHPEALVKGKGHE